MKQLLLFSITGFILASLCNRLHGQQKGTANNPVYVDKQGVLRWTKDKREAAFFGVNYTTPFAYAYRAHRQLGVDIEKAIRDDVYHFARLGFNAFRVHVWDTEISDSAGNLLANEHLRLFDYLLAELKKRNIYTIITPIAFWGNGYPERDERTPGFARKYGKGGSTTNDTAIRAQENYLTQFFNHINPYTKLKYQDDPYVIATEINNEPSHSGPKPAVTNYINRLVKSIRNTGWTKPVYYNISQGPYYADAVAKSNIDGVSFQWYPSGLVANNTLKGNYLPHVDTYAIPFDTIREFAGKTKMVYEFDAADLLNASMYPAMAKTFRQAGFQWATQFAYDPLAIAYANTEYQTHFVNLAYTPSKAISLLIAAEAFRNLPRGKQFGKYPADSSFGDFTVSYTNSLSLMNSGTHFIYSNNTNVKPVDVSQLTTIAGVGSSTLIQYHGKGAYFLDKIEEGIWRLEVLPDAIFISDPFERASPSKEVVRIEWRTHQMKINIPDLGGNFSITALNEANDFIPTNASDSFKVSPGTYLLKRKDIAKPMGIFHHPSILLNEFVAPVSNKHDIRLLHHPVYEVSAGNSFVVSANVAAGDSIKVSLQVYRLGGGPSRFLPMSEMTAGDFQAIVPAEIVTPGQLTYRIIVQRGSEYAVFPGNYKGNPFAWDSHHDQTYSTFVAAPHSSLTLFEPYPGENISIFPGWRRGFQFTYTTGDRPGKLILRMATNGIKEEQVIAVQEFIGDKLNARLHETGSFKQIVLRARMTGSSTSLAKIILTNTAGISYSGEVVLGEEFSDQILRLADLAPDSSLLLPRPYPGFQPLWFKSAVATPFRLEAIERIQIVATARPGEDVVMEVEGAWLIKNE